MLVHIAQYVDINLPKFVGAVAPKAGAAVPKAGAAEVAPNAGVPVPKAGVVVAPKAGAADVAPNPVEPNAGVSVDWVLPNSPVAGCDVAVNPNPGVAGLKHEKYDHNNWKKSLLTDQSWLAVPKKEVISNFDRRYFYSLYKNDRHHEHSSKYIFEYQRSRMFIWKKRLCIFTYLLAPKLNPPARPVVAGALDGVPNENDIVLCC